MVHVTKIISSGTNGLFLALLHIRPIRSRKCYLNLHMGLIISIIWLSIILKKFGIFWKPYNFWSYLEMRCIVLYIISLQNVFFLFYNATPFVTIASFRAEVLPLWGGRVRKEKCQIRAQQFKRQLKKHHHSAKSIRHPRDDNFNQHQCGLFCWAQIWHSALVIPPPHKGNISALVLHHYKNSTVQRTYRGQNILAWLCRIRTHKPLIRTVL